jgi:hypothetical protein
MTFQVCVNSLGHVFGALNPALFPSRAGPRHWGQSCAGAEVTISASAEFTIITVNRFAFFMRISFRLKRSVGSPGRDESIPGVDFSK